MGGGGGGGGGGGREGVQVLFFIANPLFGVKAKAQQVPLEHFRFVIVVLFAH